MHFVVRVPGTSANFGPGFDCLGVAWDIYATFTFHTRQSGNWESLRCYDSAEAAGRPEDMRNLALEAYWRYGKEMGLLLPSMGVFIESDIPSTRGLGSSAACIIAGVEAARYAALNLHYRTKEGRFTDSSLLQVATHLEGHPDNVAPALYGGLQLSRMIGTRAQSILLPITDRLRFFVLIPDITASTKKSRIGLPEKVSQEDAVFNMSALGFLLHGLQTGRASVLRQGLQDRLHEPYRTPSIPHYDDMQALVRKLGGIGMVLSGSGSTMLTVWNRTGNSHPERMEEEIPSGWQWREVHVDRTGSFLIPSQDNPADATPRKG